MNMTSELIKKLGSEQGVKKPEGTQRMALGSQNSNNNNKKGGCCY